MWTRCTLATGFCRSERTSPKPARTPGSGSLDQARKWFERWEIRWRPGPSPSLQVSMAASRGDRAAPEGPSGVGAGGFW